MWIVMGVAKFGHTGYVFGVYAHEEQAKERKRFLRASGYNIVYQYIKGDINIRLA